MSYLVIYPKRLTVQKLECDYCPGTLSCDVLQYGLLVESKLVHIELNFSGKARSGFYQIHVVQMEVIPVRYVRKFERCLNDFIFELKGMQPDFQFSNGVATWRAHFSEICFLLAGDRFEIAKTKDLQTLRMRR